MTASPRDRARFFEASMLELLSREREPLVKLTPAGFAGIPEGLPVNVVFSRDPATGQPLCTDVVDNRGHYFGADLSNRDKRALIEFLKFQ